MWPRRVDVDHPGLGAEQASQGGDRHRRRGSAGHCARIRATTNCERVGAVMAVHSTVQTSAVRPNEPARQVIATFDNYADAERAVDYLSDRGFGVNRVAIVGRDLEYVEQVLGRLNYGGAAPRGAGCRHAVWACRRV